LISLTGEIVQWRNYVYCNRENRYEQEFELRHQLGKTIEKLKEFAWAIKVDVL